MLSRKEGNLIALLWSDFRSPIFNYALTAIEAVAAIHGFRVLPVNTDDNNELEAREIRHLLSLEGIAGFLIGAESSQGNPAYKDLRNSGKPAVFIDRYVRGLEDIYPVVATDNVNGGYKATEHLIKVSKNQCPYFFTESHFSTTAEDRKAGYTQALKELLDIEVDETGCAYIPEAESSGHREKVIWESECDDIEAGKQIGEQFFANVDERLSHRPLIPIFTVNDNVAIGLYIECRKINDQLGPKRNQRKISLGKNVLVVGFDNLASWQHVDILSPSLSSVEQQPVEIGRIAAELLIQYILRGEKPESPLPLLPILRRKGSSGAIKERQ